MNDLDLDTRLSQYGEQWRNDFTPPPMPAVTEATAAGGRRWIKPLAIAAAVILIPTIAVVAVNTINRDPVRVTAGGGPSGTVSGAPKTDTVSEIPKTYEYNGQTLQLKATTQWTDPTLEKAGSNVLYVYAGANSGKVDQCTALTVAFVAEQTAESVTVVTADYGPDTASTPATCVAIGYPPYRLKVELSEPLGTRELLDEAGQVRPPFDLSTFPTLSYVPDGYTSGPVSPGNGPGIVQQTFTAGEGVLIVQAGPRQQQTQTYQKEVLATPTINGHKAEVYQSAGFPGNRTISWQRDAKTTILIQSVGTQTAPLSIDDLIKVAEGVS